MPDSHYVIQLLSTDGNSERDVMSFLDSSSTLLDRQQLRAYRSNLSGRDRLGVIYGDFQTLETANVELAKMVRIDPASKPYVRSVSKLR